MDTGNLGWLRYDKFIFNLAMNTHMKFMNVYDFPPFIRIYRYPPAIQHGSVGNFPACHVPESNPHSARFKWRAPLAAMAGKARPKMPSTGICAARKFGGLLILTFRCWENFRGLQLTSRNSRSRNICRKWSKMDVFEESIFIFQTVYIDLHSDNMDRYG